MVKSISNGACSEAGFSLLELLVTIGLATIMTGMAATNVSLYENGAENGAAEVATYIKQVRARAMSSTLAYEILPSGNGTIVARFATTCSAGAGMWTMDSNLSLDLPHGVVMNNTSWITCINSRGLPDNNFTIQIEDDQSSQWDVELLLGGAVRIL